MIHPLRSYVRRCAPLLLTLSLACASAEPPSGSPIECASDAECPGGVCDLLLGQCQRVEPPLDMPVTPDMPVIIDMSDMPATPDMETPDMPVDMTPDMRPDMGPTSEFSGCTADAQCNSWQTCNVALGRCQDARSLCQQDNNCTNGALCIGGRCSALCGQGQPACPADLSCAQAGEGVSACVALCDAFRTPDPCGPDLQCNPYFGARGLCEGVGTSEPGDMCDPDFGPQTCEPGGFCGQLRGDFSCRELCKADADCAANQACLVAFGEAPNTAGLCVTRCGAIGSENAAACGAGEGCQGLSSTLAVCLPEGTAQAGQRCTFDGGVFCRAGLSCSPAGPGALTDDPTEGICVRQCVPGAAQSGCAQGEVCDAFTADPRAGVCRKTCNTSLDDSSNGCEPLRGRCLGLDPADRLSNTPATSGTCYPPGALATGATCELDAPLGCNADDVCVDRGSFFGRDMDSTDGQCTRSCVAYDYTSSPSRCAAGQFCAVAFAGNRLGFCSTANAASRRYSVGAACDNADAAKWCNDSALCLDWVGTALSCRVVCFDDDSVCGVGQQCILIDPGNSTLGYCG
jgi:hypothetical protein